MKITILDEILDILPDFNIVAMTMDVEVEGSEYLEDIISSYEKKISEEYSIGDVLNIPLIKEARDGYKALGKDPSRYRLAVESLYRRLAKDRNLYRINNIVDIGNLLSIEVVRSVAVLDLDKIQGDVYVRQGTKDDIYEGIGRGQINVDKIPLYCDDIGPFGCPTSDVMRTRITDETKRILLMIICFSDQYLDQNRETAIQMYTQYAKVKNIKDVEVIRKR